MIADLSENSNNVDWSQVPIDTLILVREHYSQWVRRYFRGLDNSGCVTARMNVDIDADLRSWPLAILDEVDWSKVPVDTPILVRDWEDSEWVPSYFSGLTEFNWISAWRFGASSQDANGMKTWRYAKLANEVPQ